MRHLQTLSCLFLVASVISVEVPDQFDWRDKGLVTRVKDQLECEGSFYFAALDLIASHYYLKTGINLNLSEQSALDCSLGFNNGCFGGGVLNTIHFIRSRGTVLERDYPYTGSLGSCRMDSSQSLFRTIGFEILPKDEELIKTVVATIGPVAVTFRGQSPELLSSRIYDDIDCESGRRYSGLIVGYGTEDGWDFWTVKMSFGPNWAENGYIKLARNTGNRCGIADYAIYPVL